jgi:preprotein translocase subunit Sss1
MRFAPIFLLGSSAVFKIAAKPFKSEFWELAVLAACGGEGKPPD